MPVTCYVNISSGVDGGPGEGGGVNAYRQRTKDWVNVGKKGSRGITSSSFNFIIMVISLQKSSTNCH